MCCLYLPRYCEGLLHNIAPIMRVKFQYVKQYNSLYADKEVKQQFSHVVSFRRNTPLVAHVLAHKTSIDIGIYEVVYE